MGTVRYSINSRTRQGETGFEGIVQIPGLAPTKLVRRTGGTIFGNPGAVTQSAKAFAKRFGVDISLDEEVVSRRSRQVTS